MPIRKPGKVLLRAVPLEFVSRKVTGHARKSTNTDIPLIPFIDFLIVLVVFLLISFSASGELLAQKPNLVMPKAAKKSGSPALSTSTRIACTMATDRRSEPVSEASASACDRPPGDEANKADMTSQSWTLWR